MLERKPGDLPVPELTGGRDPSTLEGALLPFYAIGGGGRGELSG